MNYVIKSEKLTVTISDLGAEMMSAVGADGHEYVWGGDERYWENRAPVLFPTCGRTLNNTYLYGGKSYEMYIHGFAMHSVFEVVSQSESKITMKLSASEETLKNYPFNFELIAEYSVVDDALLANYTVKNNDEKVMPYMLGWHPGFVLEGDTPIDNFTLKFDDKDAIISYSVNMTGFGVSRKPVPYMLENSEYPLREDEIYPNDTMIFRATGDHALLSAKTEKHAVDMSWSDNLPFFCVWKEDKSEARFICLEPWSNLPGSGEEENFETKPMSRLASGKEKTYSYKVRFI